MKIRAVKKNKVKNLLELSTIEGVMIEFRDLEFGQEPSKGDIGYIDGSHAKGEHTMPDTTVYQFGEKGILIKLIKPAVIENRLKGIKIKLAALNKKKNAFSKRNPDERNTIIYNDGTYAIKQKFSKAGLNQSNRTKAIKEILSKSTKKTA